MAGSKYYAVRRGRCVGIYDNWNDCKRQVDGFAGNQYKSFSTLKEAQDYIAQGTQDPQAKDDYTADRYRSFSSVKAEGSFQQDVHESQASTKKQKRGDESLECDMQAAQRTSKKQDLYFLEFDGASKGNPGQAGAGAVLRNPDGSVIMEGVGLATNNVAEYRALIRGLKVCMSKGIGCIHVRGDSKLVVMQIQDKWKTRNENIAGLSKEAKELKSKFREFQINHVLRMDDPLEGRLVIFWWAKWPHYHLVINVYLPHVDRFILESLYIAKDFIVEGMRFGLFNFGLHAWRMRAI